MNRWMTAIAVILALVLGGWLAKSRMEAAIEIGKCKRFAADARSVATAIEEYKIDVGHYPVTMDAKMLAAAIEPEYWRGVPVESIDYFSDGTSYAMFSRWGVDGPIWNHCMFEYRDGEFVSWPDFVGWE